MITTAHREMLRWIGDAAPGTTVESRLPAHDASDPPNSMIVCYLKDVAPEAPARGLRRGPLQLALTFLIFCLCEDPLENDALLDSIVGSAANRTDLDLVDAALPPQFWLALRRAPRPALAARTVVRWERPEQRAPLVTAPLVVRPADMTALAGRLVSTEGIPIAGAEVRFDGLGALPSARTGSDGRFQFPAAPRSAAAGSFEVLARGARHTVDAAPPAGPASSAAAATSAGEVLLIIDPMGVMP